jgi:ubiquinone/menaquinone biosynthesis C-methylase UbiE
MNPIHTSNWNRIRYSVWEPMYDLLAAPFRKDRARSIERLGIRPTDRVLLAGAGTGLDLALIPAAGQVLATDITPAMVRRLQQRLVRTGLPGEARAMDAQDMHLPDAACHKVMLNLVLAVVPDPLKVIREAERVLRPGGRLVVLDKFVPPGARITIGRRLLNAVTAPLFSTIDRRFEDILAATHLRVVSDERASIGLDYRIIVLAKDA